MCGTHSSDAYLFSEHLIDMGQEYRGSLTFVSVIQSSMVCSGTFWYLAILKVPACFWQLQKHSWTLCPARQVSVSYRLPFLDFCQEPVSPNVLPLTCTVSDKPGNNLLLVDHTDDGLKLAS